MGEEREVRHKWENIAGIWYMRCMANDKHFETSWQWHENGGVCIYCGERAEDECKKRKEANRIRNEHWRDRQRKNNSYSLEKWGVK